MAKAKVPYQGGILAGQRALVVERDDLAREWLASELRARGAWVRAVSTRADALKALASHPELVVLDLDLPEGGGLEIAEAAHRLRPAPSLLIATGSRNVQEAISCGRLLATGIKKPLDAAQLDAALQGDGAGVEHIRLAAAWAVGRLGLVEARALFTRSMLERALGLSRGSKKKAASILKVSRQAIQRRRPGG